MSRHLVVRALALALLMGTTAGLAALPGQAQSTTAYTLVGEDPADDSSNDIVPGVDADAAITNDRTDILSFETSLDGDTLWLRVGIKTTPSGTSGYMYDVYFDVAGTTYFTCWTVQWVGGTESVENIKGCSRFTEGTQVGPGTTDDGVLIEGDEPAFVMWPVALGDIGATPGTVVDNVRVETWFRGASDCCVGSTTDSQYYWNQADVAPDEGTYSFTIGAASGGATPLPDLALEDVAPPSFVTAGEEFLVNGTLVIAGDAPENVTYNITSVLDGVEWPTMLRDVNGSLGSDTAALDLTLAVQVPASAAGQDANLTWRVCHEGTEASGAAEGNETGNDTGNETTLPACGIAEFQVSVFAPKTADGEEPRDEETSTGDPAGNETSDGNATAEEETLPAPGAAMLVVGLLGLVMAGRRRD